MEYLYKTIHLIRIFRLMLNLATKLAAILTWRCDGLTVTCFILCKTTDIEDRVLPR
jgi:hypothetical protein